MKINMQNFKLLNKSAIVLVEIIIYGGLLLGIGFAIYQGILFFQEWQCKKNVAAINEAIELYLSSPGAKLKTLDDIKSSLKTTNKSIPKCPSVPSKFSYLFNPAEGRVRCCYHGVH